MASLIIDFLSTENARITTVDKWLVVDEDIPKYVFTVYKHEYKKHFPLILYEGPNLKKALQTLKQE